MSTNVFEIRLGESLLDCEIKLNGQVLHGVRRVAFDIATGSAPATLTLEMFGDIIVNGQFEQESIIAVRQPLHVGRDELPRRKEA